MRGPARYAPTLSCGASLAANKREERTIEQWLKTHGVDATRFAYKDVVLFIETIEAEEVEWCVLPNDSHVFGSHFRRLFKALVSTDTELWTAAGNNRLSDDLVPALLAVDEFAERMKRFHCEEIGWWNNHEPFLPTEHKSEPSLEVIQRLVLEIHAATVQHPRRMLALLTETEKDLYLAARTDEPLTAKEICHKTAHYLNSHTKACLSHLVKIGLLTRESGRGYLRSL